MNFDYRVFWLAFALFIPFCSNRGRDVDSKGFVCSSINSPELAGEVESLRLILDSAIIEANTKQQKRSVRVSTMSASEPIHYGRDNPPE